MAERLLVQLTDPIRDGFDLQMVSIAFDVYTGWLQARTNFSKSAPMISWHLYQFTMYEDLYWNQDKIISLRQRQATYALKKAEKVS